LGVLEKEKESTKTTAWKMKAADLEKRRIPPSRYYQDGKRRGRAKREEGYQSIETWANSDSRVEELPPPVWRNTHGVRIQTGKREIFGGRGKLPDTQKSGSRLPDSAGGVLRKESAVFSSGLGAISGGGEYADKQYCAHSKIVKRNKRS